MFNLISSRLYKRGGFTVRLCGRVVYKVSFVVLVRVWGFGFWVEVKCCLAFIIMGLKTKVFLITCCKSFKGSIVVLLALILE